MDTKSKKCEPEKNQSQTQPSVRDKLSKREIEFAIALHDPKNTGWMKRND